MSEPLKHECGIAVIRLLKPLSYFQEKYGNPLYAYHKLFLLMEKQHNRGQDGAGIGCVKFSVPLGQPFMFRKRAVSQNSLMRIFDESLADYNRMVADGIIDPDSPETVKKHFDFGGELLIGHLRYGTAGNYGVSACHPYYRRSNWVTQNLMLLGNFNMTNSADLNQQLVDRGQHPIFDTDTQAVLESVGYFLDEAHSKIYKEVRGSVPGHEIPSIISERLDPAGVLKQCAPGWDGGFTIAGVIGNGDCFVIRDRWGIRPCFYFQNDEFLVFASERVPLMSVFDQPAESINELPPAHVFVAKRDGSMSCIPYCEPGEKKSCSFESIYFSRGNDPVIYHERKALGRALCDPILKAVDYDLENSVFSYIPNTAESAYYGLIQELRRFYRMRIKRTLLNAFKAGTLTEKMIEVALDYGHPRMEKIALKDIKLRTFISEEGRRETLASHVYDVTYGVVKPNDNLIVLDDSIVRGTTLKKSILRILSRTNPKRIIIASTAPQIRYPDCYGIDMSEFGKLVAFDAAISLLHERSLSYIIDDVYKDCLKSIEDKNQKNHVKRIYEPFTDDEISARISELVSPTNISWKGEIQLIFQSIENLHQCTSLRGDWYFSGDYPTPGGNRVSNQAFINYYEHKSGRAY